MPPPPNPKFALGSWEELFAELDTKLPADYVALIDAYGSIAFSEWLGVGDPRRDKWGATMVTDARETGDLYRSFRSQSPEEYPFAAWPEPGGFLPWGGSIDGDYLGWLTEGDPELWPVAVWPRHSDDHRIINLTMTEVLAGWFSGDLVGGDLLDLAPVDCQPW